MTSLTNMFSLANTFSFMTLGIANGGVSHRYKFGA
jgi:hypothetical protein